MVVISREVKNSDAPGCTRLVTEPDFIGFSVPHGSSTSAFKRLGQIFVTLGADLDDPTCDLLAKRHFHEAVAHQRCRT
jgi:hypothetical protein